MGAGPRGDGMEFDVQGAAGSREAVALVVGGSSGVGLATARRLLAQGVRSLAIAARSVERGEAAAADLSAAGADARFFACDANDPAAALELVATVTEAFGGIDMLVVGSDEARGGKRCGSTVRFWG